MFGWLKKKGQNSRVYMCAKELKWTIEGCSTADRAYLKAMSAYFFTHVLSPLANPIDTGVDIDIVDNPFAYNREQCMRFYEILENIVIQGKEQLKHLVKASSSLNMEFPGFARKHADISNRALELWMVTIGCSINPGIREDVTEIWDMLEHDDSTLLNAISQIRESNKKTLEMTDAIDEGLFDVDDEMWINGCHFRPSTV